MGSANGGAAAAAPLARLQGVKGWQVAVIEADAQRWVTLSFDWLDEELEEVAVTFDPQDAEAVGMALIAHAHQAEMRNLAERN